MSLEKIIHKILSEARAEAEMILRESQEKAEAIKEKARQEALELAARYRQEAEREANLQASRILTQARLEKKLTMLRQRKDLLEEVLRKALEDSRVQERMVRKKVILKQGEEEEALDQERLIDRLREKLENDIVEALKL